MLFVTNYAFKSIITYMSEKIGFKEISKIMNFKLYIFFVYQFIYSTLIILMMGAQLDFVPFIGDIFEGKERDFTNKWYISTGRIIVTNMLLQIVFPLVDILIPKY